MKPFCFEQNQFYLFSIERNGSVNEKLDYSLFDFPPENIKTCIPLSGFKYDTLPNVQKNFLLMKNVKIDYEQLNKYFLRRNQYVLERLYFS